MINLSFQHLTLSFQAFWLRGIVEFAFGWLITNYILRTADIDTIWPRMKSWMSFSTRFFDDQRLIVKCRLRSADLDIVWPSRRWRRAVRLIFSWPCPSWTAPALRWLAAAPPRTGWAAAAAAAASVAVAAAGWLDPSWAAPDQRPISSDVRRPDRRCRAFGGRPCRAKIGGFDFNFCLFVSRISSLERWALSYEIDWVMYLSIEDT